MKKRYEKPSMKVYELNQPARLLTGSDTDQWGRIPTIPGMPDDEKHLA